MKRWCRRTGKQWGLGVLVVLVLALALVASALAQLESMNFSAQRLATQLLPRAVQAGDLRLQLSRLRSLEIGLVRARSLGEVHAYEERLAEQQLRLREQEVRYASLLESNADFESFAMYSASLKDYLGVQQQLMALARAVDYRSAESIEATSEALVYTFAGASQGSFAETAATLEQWHHNHAAAAQQASFVARQMVERMRGWMLSALAGATVLALTLALVWTRAGGRRAGSAMVPSFGPYACTENLCAIRSSGHWSGPAVQSHSLTGAAGEAVNLRWSATPANARSFHPTHVTAEDWDSF